MEIKKYKGFDVDFDESKDVFTAYKDGYEFAQAPSLRQLEKHLDAVTKKVFNRLPIYKYEGNTYEEDELVETGEITSFNSLQKEVWITYGKEKNREKVYLSYGHYDILHKTPHNLDLLKQILSLRAQIKKLTTSVETLENKLTAYTYADLCKLTGQNPVD